jgi:lipopolysaccharide transport system ATP-binding protein
MHDVAAGDGRTILFVSHHMGALTQLCDRGIMLERGSITTSGPIGEVVKTYLRSGPRPEVCRERFAIDPAKPCQYISAELLHPDGSSGTEFDCAEPLTIRIGFEVRRYDSGTRTLTATLQNLEGLSILFTDFRDGNPSLAEQMHVGIHTFEIKVPPWVLAPTTYQLNLRCVSEYTGLIDERIACCEFTLRDLNNIRQNRPGILSLQLVWAHRHREFAAEAGAPC